MSVLTFDDLLNACTSRDVESLVRCTSAGLSINRKDHKQNPLWFLILDQVDSKRNEQQVENCMAIFWNRGLRLDSTTKKGETLPEYIFQSCDLSLAYFILGLPKAVERFNRQLNKNGGDSDVKQWWYERIVDIQAIKLNEGTQLALGQSKIIRL